MKQYIYFEDKTEYIVNREKVEQFPIGKLMFAILDVDWRELSEQAKVVQDKIRNNEDKPYVLAAMLYQEHRKMLKTFHPHIFRLVDAYMEEKTQITSSGDKTRVFSSMALRLFRVYSSKPVLVPKSKESTEEGGLTVPDQLLTPVAISFIDEIIMLYHRLYQFSANLKSMIQIALDASGDYANLSPRQRFCLMQASNFLPFWVCKHLYEKVRIERRILDETKIEHTRSLKITPEMVQAMQSESLDAYTFYRSTDVRSLVLLEFDYMCSHNLVIRKCEYCERYFLPYSKVSLFCERPVEGTDKTCKDIGAIEKYNRKVMADEARNLFRRLNNAYHMRTKRAPAVYTQEAYEAWRDNTRELLKQVEAGMLSIDEFEGMVQIDRKRD